MENDEVNFLKMENDVLNFLEAENYVLNFLKIENYEVNFLETENDSLNFLETENDEVNFCGKKSWLNHWHDSVSNCMSLYYIVLYCIILHESVSDATHTKQICVRIPEHVSNA